MAAMAVVRLGVDTATLTTRSMVMHHMVGMAAPMRRPSMSIEAGKATTTTQGTIRTSIMRLTRRRVMRAAVDFMAAPFMAAVTAAGVTRVVRNIAIGMKIIRHQGRISSRNHLNPT
jgi:hypothetical protein